MFESFPTDVIVFDASELLHARFERGRQTQLATAGRYDLPEGTFAPAPVTPTLENEEALAAIVRRVRLENGRFDRVSLLLPDSWFRTSILQVAGLPERKSDADEIVQWTLRRNMPVTAEALRIAYAPIERNGAARKVLAIAAVEKTLQKIEALFRTNGVSVGLIESTALNLWNAIAVREGAAAGERVLIYSRPTEFTIAVFRGDTPLFIRSRPMSDQRTLLQEIRLSASYLKSNVQTNGIEVCYVGGGGIDASIVAGIGSEFTGEVRELDLSEFAERPPSIDTTGIEAELAACTGVFTR